MCKSIHATAVRKYWSVACQTPFSTWAIVPANTIMIAMMSSPIVSFSDAMTRSDLLATRLTRLDGCVEVAFDAMVQLGFLSALPANFSLFYFFEVAIRFPIYNLEDCNISVRIYASGIYVSYRIVAEAHSTVAMTYRDDFVR